MPSGSALKTTSRFTPAQGDRRDWQPPESSPEQKGGLMFCHRCGITYLVTRLNQFASCESCGGLLVIEKK